MKRIRYTETKVIGNLTFIINTVENLEYSGQWYDAGFDVYFNGHTKNFCGYPFEKELLEFSKQISNSWN